MYTNVSRAYLYVEHMDFARVCIQVCIEHICIQICDVCCAYMYTYTYLYTYMCNISVYIYVQPTCIVVVWLFIGTQKKVSDPPPCPRWLTKRRTYRPRSVIYRHVGRQSSEKMIYS
jgi:hypothetical protein